VWRNDPGRKALRMREDEVGGARTQACGARHRGARRHRSDVTLLPAATSAPPPSARWPLGPLTGRNGADGVERLLSGSTGSRRRDAQVPFALFPGLTATAHISLAAVNTTAMPSTPGRPIRMLPCRVNPTRPFDAGCRRIRR
jgi:hypothetical protein